MENVIEAHAEGRRGCEREIEKVHIRIPCVCVYTVAEDGDCNPPPTQNTL